MQAIDPERLGFRAERLSAIRSWYQGQFVAGRLTGAVVAIARHGGIAYLDAIGTLDAQRRIPMTTDAIFWIASMTKPVASVAAMLLVEAGELELDTPIHRFIPGFADMKVGVENAASGNGPLVLEPAQRPITVRHLLQHTSGLVYPDDGDTAVHRLHRGAAFRRDATLAEFVASLEELPLAHQPGDVWEYSWGTDVLARVVEIVSGEPFDEFLERRIFKRLGMVDTGFHVPQAKLARLADPPPSGRPALWDVTRPPRLHSGSGGLVSTARDYLNFCQMLLNGGELNGERILAPQTVRQMTTASLSPEVRFAGAVGGSIGPRWGSSWGLGFAVRTDPSSTLAGRIGSLSWGGAWGTRFWVDPAEKLAAVQMIQIEPDDDNGRYRRALSNLTYDALRASQ